MKGHVTSLLEHEGARKGWRDGGREKEVLMSEGLCCGKFADLPLLAVDDWLAL